MISVFQIYFDATSKKGLEKEFYEYNNEFSDNDYFESHVMKRVYNMDAVFKEGIKYLGVTSWKQFNQTHITAKEIIDNIQGDINNGIQKEVYLYSPITGGEPEYDFSDNPKGTWSVTIRQPDIWHARTKKNPQLIIDTKLLNDSKVLPFDLSDCKWQYVYRNYWIATKEIYDKYCQTVLLPALEFFERPEIKGIMPKWYTHSHNGKKYNSCAFILEGLFGSFLAENNYTFKYLLKKPNRNNFEWIKVKGYEITNA